MTHAPCHACGRPAVDTIRNTDNTWIAVCDHHDHRTSDARLLDDMTTVIDEWIAGFRPHWMTWDMEHELATDLRDLMRAHIAHGWGR